MSSKALDPNAVSIGDPVATDVAPTTAYSSELDTTSSTSQGTTIVFVTSTKAANTTSINSSMAMHSTASATPGSISDESSTSSDGADSTMASGLSAGASAGIGVGVALGVLLLAILVFSLYRRRRKHRETARGEEYDRPVLPELGTDGQKHELPAEESGRTELGNDEPKCNNTNVQELE